MTQQPPKEPKTHFGYQEVPTVDKSRHVAAVFHSVAGKYDVMNDLMSLGLHRLWKRYAIELVGARQGHKILDLAGGTGDLAKSLLQRVGTQGQVVLVDINAAMLERGRERLLDAGFCRGVNYIQADAEQLPFPEHYFDAVTMAFGLRNVTHQERALREMLRVLKPGGKALVLEFSKPASAWLRALYDRYSFSVLPKLGQLIAGDAASYQYLVESIRMHPDQQRLQALMETAGFERCDYHNLSGGIVALHRGYKF